MIEAAVDTNRLSQNIKLRWDDHALQGNLDFDVLDPLNRVREKSVGKYNVYFNPGRATYMLGKIRDTIYVPYDQPHDPQEDAFCKNKTEVLQKQKLGEVVLENDAWDILSNKSPIATHHSILLPAYDIDRQHLKAAYIEDLILFSKMSTDMTLTVNSAGAGASQNHFHSHIFYQPMPLTELPTVQVATSQGVDISKPADYPIVSLAFKSEDPKMTTAVVTEHVDDLIERKIPYNAIIIDGTFYLIPRSKEGEDEFPSRGFDTVAGSFPVLNQANFDQFGERQADNILKELGFEHIEIAGRSYQY